MRLLTRNASAARLCSPEQLGERPPGASLPPPVSPARRIRMTYAVLASAHLGTKRRLRAVLVAEDDEQADAELQQSDPPGVGQVAPRAGEVRRRRLRPGGVPEWPGSGRRSTRGPGPNGSAAARKPLLLVVAFSRRCPIIRGDIRNRLAKGPPVPADPPPCTAVPRTDRSSVD
jgi:hypothetical protein